MTRIEPELPLYVIADLHLSRSDPSTAQLFFDWLNSTEFAGQTLIILGDLFEAWIGDDLSDPLAEQVADHLRELSTKGVKVFFVEGNRDFLIGPSYCDRCQMTRLAEPIIFEGPLAGTTLIHGDVLCTDDLDYQRFRARSRQPEWQQTILRLPKWLRQALARWARWKSQRRYARLIRRSPAIADVNPNATQAFAERYEALTLIHGHTHKLSQHRSSTDLPRTRWVLGDWHENHGSVLAFTASGASLHTLSRRSNGTVQWSDPVPPDAH